MMSDRDPLEFPRPLDRPKPDQEDGPADDPILLQDLENRAAEVGRMLRGVMPEGVGFCFIMFTFGEGGWLTYASNAERAHMRKALQELIDKMDDMDPQWRDPSSQGRRRDDGEP